jgi:hypothetical protein
MVVNTENRFMKDGQGSFKGVRRGLEGRGSGEKNTKETGRKQWYLYGEAGNAI